MKQLLHISDNDGFIIVGLHDTVFVGRSGSSAEDESAVCYRLPLPTRKDAPTTATSSQQQASIEDPTNNTTTTSTTPEIKTTTKKKNGNNMMNPFDVQAVAVTAERGRCTCSDKSVWVVWCAVALYDKSLYVYTLVVADDDEVAASGGGGGDGDGNDGGATSGGGDGNDEGVASGVDGNDGGVASGGESNEGVASGGGDGNDEGVASGGGDGNVVGASSGGDGKDGSAPCGCTGCRVTVLHETIHKTAKRVSTLCFATVPSGYREEPSDDNDTGSGVQLPLTVVVAGDLAGDVTAYSLIKVDEDEPLASTEKGSKEPISSSSSMEDDRTTANRRLLLGHTASMLTSVIVVTNEDRRCKTANPRTFSRILSADRDEKIRVSCFPNAYCIQGYLLGHEAFISSMAVAPQTRRCVSVGGDYTLRMWDYARLKQLAVASTLPPLLSTTNTPNESTTTTNNDDGAKTTLVVENQRDNDINNSTGVDNESSPDLPPAPTTAAVSPIPSKVAISSDGSIIAVIYDDTTYIDFWRVRSAKKKENETDPPPPVADKTVMSNYNLEYSQRVECTVQPLSMSFMNHNQLILVLREPIYMQIYHVKHETGSEVLQIIIESNDAFAQSVIEQATAMGPNGICMPQQLLERDEYGNLKMEKMNELQRSGGGASTVWNNRQRKEVDRERIRRKRRRREQHAESESPPSPGADLEDPMTTSDG